MVIHSLFRHLLCDTFSLKMYMEGRRVALSDIKRHLMLLERMYDMHIPDHYYRLSQENTFQDINNVNDVLTKGLQTIANTYLELRENQVFVKPEMQNEWQLTLPCMPPLLLIATVLQQNFKLNSNNYTQYLHDYVLPNTRYTALPYPFIKQLENLRKERHGLYDLHIHLNGTLETDITWQDFLIRPDDIYKELQEKFKDEKVKEQYEQISPLITPLKFREILDIAFTIREEIFKYIIEQSDSDSRDDESFDEKLLRYISRTNVINSRKHPLAMLVGDVATPMQLECLFYVMVLDYLNSHNQVYIANLFHFYLLVLGLTNQMLVQQTLCYGFEEFQKYTLNGMREVSEMQYLRRFLQISGNQLNNVKFMEGRFSPKDNLSKNEALINNILEGWKRLTTSLDHDTQDNKPELKLIAHFIKQPDYSPNNYIRHKKLRKSLLQRANILCFIKNNHHPYAKMIVGIDAAASEFDAPPEVFSQIFQLLRSQGYKHFTFHAGEDFFHILSGLRSIFEAVEFLDLRRGDRIGHATASGVSVGLWHHNIGEQMLIRKGEHLDNLLFAHYLISRMENESLNVYIPALIAEINELSFQIYGEYNPPYLLEQAWLKRKDDPERILEKGASNDVDKLFLKYHEKEISKKYNEIITIKTYDILGEKELIALQLFILEWLHDKEIVIETLPTSNVIIGHHHNFKTYHLYNWLQWKKENHPIPPIVVGTDDSGIFATNIYNEYCNIYCYLMYEKQMNSTDVIHFIEELDYNSYLYCFLNDDK